MILHLSKQIEATKVNRVKHYVELSMTLAFLSELVRVDSLVSAIGALVYIALWLGLYVLTFRALKRMMYSFLTLQLITLVISAVGAYVHYSTGELAAAILLVINIVAVIGIIFSVNRPIFYPKINWTEYDFRHRKDKRIEVEIGEKREPARIYDTRKGEAAIVSLNELELDHEYALYGYKDDKHRVRVLSQRRALLGRPAIYGVKFIKVK
ncbi:MAG: hypothetical protein CME71_04255 [Halobacteriovorax sp.]|nr:hypothetical protein [Halobacteriovorax sp.]|tara:strand:- start:1756 stop:2385 length:630 start_codon:yes stop_codon:yes gene_type:complete